MATVINTPSQGEGNNGLGFFLAIIVLIVFLLWFVFYAIPYLGRSLSGQSPIQIPSKIDVNVKQTK